MRKKYFSMLLGGTLTMMVVSIMLMSDSIIAGAVLGSDAVAGVTLVTPVYSFSAFFGIPRGADPVLDGDGQIQQEGRGSSVWLRLADGDRCRHCPLRCDKCVR